MATSRITHPGVTTDGRPCAVLYIEPGAVLETGLWCSGCRLPAAVKVEILALSDDGFVPVLTAAWCDGCRHLCEGRHGCQPTVPV